MKLIGLVGVLCLLNTLAIAQTLVVTDTAGMPVEGCIVSGDSLSLITGEDGKISLQSFGKKEKLTFQHGSFKHIKTTKSQLVGFYSVEGEDVVLELTPSGTELPPVNIPGDTYWELEPDEIPIPLLKLPNPMLCADPKHSTADVLANSGQVFVQKSQFGGGSPMIRGFSANRILLVVDGVRMNNAIFRSGNLHNIIAIDPYSVDEGEVVLGPGAVAYGSDALGGVIDFHSMRPKYFSEDSVSVVGNALLKSSSAAGEMTFHGDLNYRRDRVSILTSFSLSHFGDLKMGSNGPTEYLRNQYVQQILGRDSVVTNPDSRVQVGSGYEQVNFLNKVRFSPMDGWDFTYAFHHSETTNIPRYDRLIQEINGAPRYGDWYYGPQKWSLHAVNAIHEGNHKLLDKVRINFGHQIFEESRNDRDLNSNYLRQRTERVRASSLNLGFEKVLADSSVIYYGAEAVSNFVKSLGWQVNLETGQTEGVASRYPDASTWESGALYINYKRRLGEKLNLLGGIRYSHVWIEAPFDSTYYQFPFQEIFTNVGALSGSTGFAWRLSELWKISANLATGFRAPNIDDIGKVFDSEPGNVVVPNVDLKPEYAYTADIGFKYTDPKDVATMEIAGFFTILDNAMIRGDYTFNGQDSIMYDGQLSRVQALVNADGATMYGASLAGQVNFLDHFFLRGNFNWSAGETNNGEPIRHIPPVFADLRLQYNQDKWNASIFARYNGTRSFDQLAPSEQDKPHLYAENAAGNPYLPSWFTLNLTSSAQVRDDLNIVLGVENILDARYRTYSSGITAPGRNFYGSVRYSF